MSKSYVDFKLTEACRQAVLATYQPKFSDIRADHVTIAHGVSEDFKIGQALRSRKGLKVVAYVCDDNLETLIVEVDGELVRPDGKIFHLTLSKDASRRSFESNRLVSDRSLWQTVEALELEAAIVFIADSAVS